MYWHEIKSCIKRESEIPYVRAYSVFLSMSDSFHLASCLLGSFHLASCLLGSSVLLQVQDVLGNVDGHLCFLHIVAFGNEAAMNKGAQTSLWGVDFISLGYIPKRGIAGSYAVSICKVLRSLCVLFSIAAVPIGSLTNSAQAFPFLHTFTNTYYCIWEIC